VLTQLSQVGDQQNSHYKNCSHNRQANPEADQGPAEPRLRGNIPYDDLQQRRSTQNDKSVPVNVERLILGDHQETGQNPQEHNNLELAGKWEPKKSHDLS
jgi:hypothetical protein